MYVPTRAEDTDQEQLEVECLRCDGTGEDRRGFVCMHCDGYGTLIL